MGFEVGEVMSKAGNQVQVRLLKKSACESCHCCSFSQEDKYMILSASDMLGAKVGQKVKLEIAELSQLKFGFILYILPLVFFLAGYLLAEWAGRQFGLAPFTSQVLSVFTGFLLLTLPFLALIIQSRKKKNSKRWSIRVVEVEPDELY